MQYLYASGKDRVFMDTESFEQYTLPTDAVGRDADFLAEGESYRVLAIEGQPVMVQLSPVVVLEVTDTAPSEHGGGGSNVLKEAKLASGIIIHVPLFIKNGDKIRVKTDTREYRGKEHCPRPMTGASAPIVPKDRIYGMTWWDLDSVQFFLYN